MKNFLEEIDIFGHDFNFSVFNKKQHRTYVGGILSLLTICCTFVSTLYFGKDFYFRTNPMIVNDRIQYPTYPQYKIDSSNFVFGFRVEDSKLNFFNESSFFEFKVIYNNSNMTRNQNGTITEYDAPVINLNYSKCDIKKFINLNFTSNDTVDYLNFYCIEFPSNLMMGGYWTANYTQYIDINLVNCNPDNNSNCTS